MSELFKTPILFLTFNRPDTTRIVFNEMLKVNPAQLYIAQDGPRKNKPGETEKCREVREIFRQISPECKVKTLFRENNLGCREAVGSAITWFFENVEEGIILEDDDLPHPDFFLFCREMLEKYRDNKEVMHISGSNFNFGKKAGNSSYCFSKFVHLWGFATWRRAWRYYDPEMKNWPEFVKQKRIYSIIQQKKFRESWMNRLQENYLGITNLYYSYCWIYAIWNQNGLCVTPNANLVSNIGFEKDAPPSINSKLANMKICAIGKIVHPTIIQRDKEADKLIFKAEMPLLAEWIKIRQGKVHTLKIILSLPETILKLILSAINPKLTWRSTHVYKMRLKYSLCKLSYKLFGKKSAVKLAEIIDPG